MSGPVDEMLALGEGWLLGRPAAYGIPGRRVRRHGRRRRVPGRQGGRRAGAARRGAELRGLPHLPLPRPPRRRPPHLPGQGRAARCGGGSTPSPTTGTCWWSRAWPRPRELETWTGEAADAVAAAVDFAESQPGARRRRPSWKGCSRERPSADSGRERTLTYAQALNEALREEMRRDPAVMLMGEDIGGVGRRRRVRRHPRAARRVRRRAGARHAHLGGRVHRASAVGAALAGLRPVVEYMYVDFAMLAMDQICNQAAKIRWMLGGEVGRAAGHPGPAGRGPRQRPPALPEPGGLVHPHPGPHGGPAQHALRRQGTAQDRHPQTTTR